MQVYQVIYTSVEHSLSDAELGLVNKPGLKVYSCSQGLTKENLDEIVRFSSYRLPKNNTKEYSQVVGDPSVSELFPKIFRTIKLSDGKTAAIQAVYSGVDHKGYEGNFFAHALVFEDYDNEFFPEKCYGSKYFKTHLTTQEAECELVRYLPVIEDFETDNELEKEISEFIKNHQKEMSHIISNAMTVLTSDTIKNLCIATSSEKDTAMYLLSLKYLFPSDIADNMGISTYNVYLPSDKQDKIVFHGTIKGENNITPEAIEYRKNCIYIDMDSIDCASVQVSPLIANWSLEELREEYKQSRIKSFEGLIDWISCYENVTSPGMGSKLIRLRNTAGEAAFIKRANEIYPHMEEEEYSEVRFEITKVMYDNIDYFQKYFSNLIESYITLAVKKLCEGESYDLGGMFSSKLNERMQIAELKKQVDNIMKLVSDSQSKMTNKNKFVILGLFAHIKHKFGDETWKDFFGGNRNHLTVFMEMGAHTIVTGYGTKPFDVPTNWTKEDMCEFVAFLEASTEDKTLTNICLKYIYSTTDVDWSLYGITKTKHKKTQGAQKKDIEKIQGMLRRVGYEPYQNGKYTDIITVVNNDMERSVSPLLITKTLNTYYQWQRAYGDQAKAKELAVELRDYLLEMRKNQIQLYNYMIPKLALEIIESRSHYHEVIINRDTMCDSFWNWFLIGYKKCRKDDEKALNYARIYKAISTKISKLPVRKKLRAAFKDVVC